MARTVNFDAVLRISGAITSSFTNALKGSRVQMDSVTKSIRDATKEQRSLAQEMARMSRNGPAQVGAMVTRYRELQRAIDGARQAQERMDKAAARRDRINSAANTTASMGAHASGSGRSMIRAELPLIQAAIHRENEVNVINNTGISSADRALLVAAGAKAKQFGVSKTEAYHTLRELQSALGDAHHAVETLPLALQAKSGMALYNRSNPGKELSDDTMFSLAKIADERGGATSAAEMAKQLDLAFRAVTASQGKISATEWLYAQRGSKAAGVAMNSEAFFGDSFLVQAMGAPQYGKAVSTLNNAWIGGHQDAHKFTNMWKDGLLNPNQARTKNGLVTNYTSDALIDNKLFISDPQAWVEKHLFPLAKRKGVDMADPAAVQKFISNYTSNTNAGNILFQRMFNQAAIDRDRKLFLTALGIKESDKANQASTGGKIDEVKARYNDAKVGLGEALMPSVTKGLLAATAAMETFNIFAKENPTLVSTAVLAVGGLGVALTVLGPVLTFAAVATNLFAAAQMRSAAASIAAGLRSTQLGGAAAGAGRGMMGAVVGTLKWAGALGLIAAGLYNIYTNMDMLKRVKANAMDSVKNVVETAYNWAGQKVGAGDNAWAKTQAFFGNEDALKIQASKERYDASVKAGKVQLPSFQRANAASFVPPSGDHRTQTFNITQLSGESGEAFAKRVAATGGIPGAPKSSSAMHD